MPCKLADFIIMADGKPCAVLQQMAVGVIDDARVNGFAESRVVFSDVAANARCNDAFKERAGKEVATCVEVDVLTVSCEFIANVKGFHAAGILNSCAARDDDVDAAVCLHLLNRGADVLPHGVLRLVFANVLVFGRVRPRLIKGEGGAWRGFCDAICLYEFGEIRLVGCVIT